MTSTVAQTAADRVTRAAGPANGTPCVLLMFGELALKGRKRASFAAALERNLRRALRAAGRVELQRRGSSILVMAPPDALPRVLEIATEMLGLSVVQPALRLEPSSERASRAAVALLRGWPARSFAVRSRRREKSFPVSSMEMACVVGAGGRWRGVGHQRFASDQCTTTPSSRCSSVARSSVRSRLGRAQPVAGQTRR